MPLELLLGHRSSHDTACRHQHVSLLSVCFPEYDGLSPDHCRATTCYLVQRRIDMLPKPLTEDICSLRSNVERLAFSAIWEITQDAQVLNVRYTPNTISELAIVSTVASTGVTRCIFVFAQTL